MKKYLLAFTILGLLSSCSDKRHAYQVELTYYNGDKDTVAVSADEEYGVWLGDKGCFQAPSKVIACGVRSYSIISKK